MMKIKYKDNRHVFDVHDSDGVIWLSYPAFSDTGLVNHGFSTRLGGVSKGVWASMNISTSRGDDPADIAQNEILLGEAVGVNPAKMVFTRQVHKTEVRQVFSSDARKSFDDTDGLITDVPGLCLVTFFADCVPLYFLDPVKKAIGLSHSGWRGTVADMAGATIRKMQNAFGTDPKHLITAIGPSICQDCYEVSADVILAFKERYPESAYKDLFYEKNNGKFQLNLWKANELNLLRHGVRPSNIHTTNLCTCCNPEFLFSHRVTGFDRGNVSALLALKEDR